MLTHKPLLSLIRRRTSGRWWNEMRVESSSDAPRRFLQRRKNRRQLIDDGYGRPVTRQYFVDLSNATSSITDSFEAFANAPDDFLDVEYANFGGKALRVGENVLVRIGAPWDGPVEVLRRTANSIVLVTREGHLEAGWIEFAAFDSGGKKGFRVRSCATAGDPLFLFVHSVLRIGRWVQADLWCTVCESVARSCGVESPPIVDVSTVEHVENS